MMARAVSMTVLIILLVLTVPVFASSIYYITPDGSGDCSQQSPCSYAQAEAQSSPGDTIVFLEGVYGAVIVGKDGLTLDGRGQAVIDTTAQNGVRIARDNVTIRGFTVQRTWSHAILVTGKNVTIENNTVRQSIRQNANLLNDSISSCKSTGWGSAIKAQVGAENTVVKNNTVYQNCGEGIAITRGLGAMVIDNLVYDNFSVNIYTDNSPYVNISGNTSLCFDQRFFRNNAPARGILLGIENYSGWGNQAHNILINYNYIERCGGIRLYAESGYSLGENVVIHDNVFRNVSTPFVSVPGATVYNNTSGTLTPTPTLADPTSPPAITPTFTATTVPTFTPTLTPSPTFTFTPVPTFTFTPTLTETALPTFTPVPISTSVPPTSTSVPPAPSCGVFEWEDIIITICRKSP